MPNHLQKKLELLRNDQHQSDIKLEKFQGLRRFIHSAGLSVRATNVILKNCSSLQDLISLDPENLYALPNCGHKTTQEIIRFLETIRETGDIRLPPSIKEQLAKSPNESSISLLPLFSSRTIEDITIQDLHPDFHASIKLEDIVLSTRTAKVLKSYGLKTLGEIMLTPASILLKQQNFGKKSLSELREIVRSFCLQENYSFRKDKPESQEIDYSSYEAMISGFVRASEKSERNQKLLYTKFCFRDGKVPTLEELGQAFGITRERVRQILKRGIAKLQKKVVFDQLTFFWQTLDQIIVQGGGIIHLGALASLLKDEFKWPSAPYSLALGQLLSLRFPKQSFKKETDIITVDCQCRDCEQPLRKLHSLDFDGNESFHIQVISLKLTDYCRQTCLWNNPVITFHQAFIERLVDQRNERLILHGDIILSHDRWLGKYCNNLEDVACHVLECHGKPMHFKDIAAAIRKNENFSQISDHNVHSSILRYTDRIEIVKRGFYGLKKWGLGGYRSVSRAIEEIIDNQGIPIRQKFIIQQLKGEFSEQNIIAALTNWTNRFQAIGDGFYDRTPMWQKRTCTKFIQLLPETVAQFAHYLVSRNNTSYKPVMAFIFIRSMNEHGAIYLSKLKQMFYNFYLSRHKKGLVVEADSALMSRIGELPANELKNKTSKEPLKSFLSSGFFKNFSMESGKLCLIDSLFYRLNDPSVKDQLLITLLKAIDDYFQQITPTVTRSIPQAEDPDNIIELDNPSLEAVKKSKTIAPTLNIKKKGKGKIKL